MKKRLIMLLASILVTIMCIYILVPASNADELTLNTTNPDGTTINPDDEIEYYSYWEFEEGATIQEVIDKQKEESTKWAKESFGEDVEVEFLYVNVYKLNGTKIRDLTEAQQGEPLAENSLVSTNLVIESGEHYYKTVDGERQELPSLGQGNIVATVIKGDITGKGDVDVTDLSQMQEQLVETTDLKGPYREAADMNSDQEIDVLDLSEIQEYIVNN